MREYLEQDMECEGLLECGHGLGDLDLAVFRTLAESPEPLSIDEVAVATDRERSTAYRAIQRLVDAGFVQKQQVNYADGGYYHVYHAADPERVADDMQRMLNDWYAKMGMLVGEFREKYAEAASEGASEGASD